jgi:hypothetical protein
MKSHKLSAGNLVEIILFTLHPIDSIHNVKPIESFGYLFYSLV